uniref:Uncharacterized protein n=1 Tax=Glossina brevipalpis TaxID=37001 RepID=A0A1A9X4L9_9MUSC
MSQHITAYLAKAMQFTISLTYCLHWSHMSPKGFAGINRWLNGCIAFGTVSFLFFSVFRNGVDVWSMCPATAEAFVVTEQNKKDVFIVIYHLTVDSKGFPIFTHFFWFFYLLRSLCSFVAFHHQLKCSYRY